MIRLGVVAFVTCGTFLDRTGASVSCMSLNGCGGFGLTDEGFSEIIFAEILIRIVCRRIWGPRIFLCLFPNYKIRFHVLFIFSNLTTAYKANS